MMTITLEALAANQDVANHLAELCEFELQFGQAEPPFCSVDGAADLTVIARDGAGGQFAMSPASRRIFYFSSEGQAGLLAEDFDIFITLIVHRPYWQDLLKYSAGGNLDEMCRAAPGLEDDWSADEDNEASRAFLITQLDLGEPGDIVAALHKAVSTTIDIRDPWGNATASLFGTYTIDDNPMLKFASD
ncbi:MAG: hypothetical protein JWO28_2397 [Hyphomicrobiales bacterium]|jgi:hypothetical protein|nr:hypothetical protein [Hyphomicrobiales bacterium]